MQLKTIAHFLATCTLFNLIPLQRIVFFDGLKAIGYEYCINSSQYHCTSESRRGVPTSCRNVVLVVGLA